MTTTGTVRVQHVISGGPDGEVVHVVEVADGAVVAASLGADDTSVLTFAERHDDTAAMLAGDLAPDDAFMRGRVKLTGSMGTYMDLLPVLRSDAYRAARAKLA